MFQKGRQPDKDEAILSQLIICVGRKSYTKQEGKMFHISEIKGLSCDVAQIIQILLMFPFCLSFAMLERM